MFVHVIQCSVCGKKFERDAWVAPIFEPAARHSMPGFEGSGVPCLGSGQPTLYEGMRRPTPIP